MKPFTRKLLIINVLLLFIVSCTREKIEVIEKTPEQEIIREIALIVGNVLQNPEVNNEVLNAMSIVDEYNELVSIAYLMGSNENLKKNEIAAVSSFSYKNAGNAFFRNAVVNEFNSNKHDYPAISRTIKEEFPESVRLKNASFYGGDNFTELLEYSGYQIYFPYAYNRNIQAPLESYYVSYDPLNGMDSNEGFFFEPGMEGFVVIDEMNNDFIDDNPVFGIIPVDPCDIPGVPCDFTELKGYSDEEVAAIYSGLPPVFPNQAQLITHNFHHIHMTDDKDMISSRIPLIRVNSRAYMGFLASRQKLIFKKASGQAPTRTPAGLITVPGLPHTVGKAMMRRHELGISRPGREKKGKWVVLNGDFDADWKMSENTQFLAVFSTHNIGGLAEIMASIKVGFKKDPTGKWVSTPEPTFSGKIPIQQQKSISRANSELERRQVFITNVGKHSTSELVIDGIPFNIKQLGHIEYVFNHWHTSLVE